MKIAKKIATGILIFLLVFVLLIMLLNLFLNLRYAEFYRNSESVGEVAGIADGLAHQGLDYIESCNMLLTSGYMADGSASRIYVNVDGTERYVVLLNEDGSEYTGHAGGIAHFSDFIYIATNGGVDVFSLKDVMDGKSSTKLLGHVKLNHDASCVTVHNGSLYIGKFSEIIKEKTTTPASPEHIIENPNRPGDMNYSAITEYILDSSATESFGIKSTVPNRIISCTDRLQGFTFTESGNIILSTSWGLTTSKIYFYNKDITATPDGYRIIDGTSVPWYFLGEDSLAKTLDAPPMAEEMVIIDGSLYVMNESSSIKYIFGNFTGGRELYAYDLCTK